MAKAIFVVPFVDNNPAIDISLVLGISPPDGYGYSCIGHVPQAPTCLVLIVSSDEVLDTLSENPDYLFIEDVTDG